MTKPLPRTTRWGSRAHEPPRHLGALPDIGRAIEGGRLAVRLVVGILQVGIVVLRALAISVHNLKQGVVALEAAAHKACSAENAAHGAAGKVSEEVGADGREPVPTPSSPDHPHISDEGGYGERSVVLEGHVPEDVVENRVHRSLCPNVNFPHLRICETEVIHRIRHVLALPHRAPTARVVKPCPLALEWPRTIHADAGDAPLLRIPGSLAEGHQDLVSRNSTYRATSRNEAQEHESGEHAFVVRSECKAPLDLGLQAA
mmetsp:Transcript_104606/g.234860  ORF Transcript_104606/g.234860 Transcript_104606/m.234860 type:complete len:259 (+) Transcript_104606:20-796(+)